MIRLRRLRGSEAIRNMVRENRVNKEDLVYPMFVAEGTGIKNPVDSMPGIYQYSLDTFEEELRRVADAGISAVLLFGIPAHKDEVGSSAYDDQGIMQKAVRRIKELYPDMIVIADICLCEYTSHGHCGIIHDGKILNDETLPYLGKMAVSLAKAGADMVAPSDMMDGHTAYIRKALDDNGLTDVLIMGYSAKFASGYKGLVALVAWKLCRKDQPLLALLSFLLAEAVMVLGYFLLEWALYGIASAAAAIGPNVVQGIAGVLIGMLCLLIAPRLERVAKL